ncbi:hypothetical protein PVAND_008261 [Polypedilum vanderplanki]|uniref:Sulfotransferase domain-containing protein n=1 Tax=Polypedilum vanderplanki TaxID=319348 RepID=A0A9J6C9N4_POLVA|nr:hypothetical protein PVAND_008261 [Polypedilum vanderplanki]
MFESELLTNEVVKKIDCPGCFDHSIVSLKNDKSGRSCVMINKYMDLFAERVKNMKVFDDDVWVISFPKCGTTWCQEMVWLINNDLDYESALETNLNVRFPFLELNGVLNKFNGDSVGICENQSRPRHIKSHLPIFLLPHEMFDVNPKIIYIARNPLDVATSFFHHYTHIVGYEGTREDFVEAFLSNQVIYAPFNEHVLDFWKIRTKPNVLFLFYEDMKRKMPNVVKETMTFLGKKFSNDQINKLCEHLSIKSMRANASCNNISLVEMAQKLNGKSSNNIKFQFIRKGEIGTFKDEKFGEKISAKLDAFIKQPSLIINNFAYKF